MSLALYHDSYAATKNEPEKGHIVLLHGWGMNSLVWDELIPYLNEAYKITVIDLPGLGRSPMPAGEYDLKYLLDHVLSVAPENAIWVGWSLGGLVVQKIAAEYPERVSRAIVVAGTPKFVSDPDWVNAMSAPIFDKFFQMLEEDWQGTLIRFLTLQCKNSESIKEDTKKLREILFHHGLPATKALREGLRVLEQEDLREALSNIKVPIAFLLGAKDNLIPIAIKDALIQVNPNILQFEIPGASHVPHLSHPAETASAIHAFLNDEMKLEQSKV